MAPSASEPLRDVSNAARPGGQPAKAGATPGGLLRGKLDVPRLRLASGALDTAALDAAPKQATESSLTDPAEHPAASEPVDRANPVYSPTDDLAAAARRLAALRGGLALTRTAISRPERGSASPPRSPSPPVASAARREEVALAAGAPRAVPPSASPPRRAVMAGLRARRQSRAVARYGDFFAGDDAELDRVLREAGAASPASKGEARASASAPPSPDAEARRDVLRASIASHPIPASAPSSPTAAAVARAAMELEAQMGELGRQIGAAVGGGRIGGGDSVPLQRALRSSWEGRSYYQRLAAMAGDPRGAEGGVDGASAAQVGGVGGEALSRTPLSGAAAAAGDAPPPLPGLTPFERLASPPRPGKRAVGPPGAARRASLGRRESLAGSPGAAQRNADSYAELARSLESLRVRTAGNRRASLGAVRKSVALTPRRSAADSRSRRATLAPPRGPAPGVPTPTKAPASGSPLPAWSSPLAGKGAASGERAATGSPLAAWGSPSAGRKSGARPAGSPSARGAWGSPLAGRKTGGREPVPPAKAFGTPPTKSPLSRAGPSPGAGSCAESKGTTSPGAREASGASLAPRTVREGSRLGVGTQEREPFPVGPSEGPSSPLRPSSSSETWQKLALADGALKAAREGEARALERAAAAEAALEETRAAAGTRLGALLSRLREVEGLLHDLRAEVDEARRDFAGSGPGVGAAPAAPAGGQPKPSSIPGSRKGGWR